MSWDHWDHNYYFICTICGKKVDIIEHIAENDFFDTRYSYTYEKCSCGFDFEKEMNAYFNNMTFDEYEHHRNNSSLANYHRGTTWEEYKQATYCEYKNIKLKNEEGVDLNGK